MSAKEKAAFLIFAATLLIAFAMWKMSGVMVRFDNGAKVKVEVASDLMEVTTGLMSRDKLGKDKGMLFSYGYDDYHSIWMKNMRFPIDIIWIDYDNRIVEVTRDAKPCLREPCAVYRPSKKVKYALEVNANFTEENNVIPGQTVVMYHSSLFRSLSMGELPS